MAERAAGTNGGRGGASDDALRRRHLLWLIAAGIAFIAIQSVANVESTIEDMAKLGVAETRVHVWTWQLTSVAVWLALIPMLWWLTARLRPPRCSWGMAVLFHALATVPVSLAHVLAMVALRKLIYAAGGESYAFDDWPMGLLYEYRKDVATYAMGLAFVGFGQWLLSRPLPELRVDAVLEVPDGSITHRVPVDEIDWAASAGNYVEIAWGPRTLLHRCTLAALQDQLGPGFARIHRGRLVRRAAVRAVETDRSGDFSVTLASGTQLRGSRRFREGL
ncbi:LytTR family DNA-binding domain-containing protein [Sphingomonas sp. AOB5]|uniref:LytTR family DNA-binding domain-containing protein n=1 Tax=Sphingomonas sp. AOB5 TaxID=3034017 RepID=UPI0023FA0FE3|nr:LytTR family DNA-binding domain-containing protein [Sphingomonas sp. AOB5]MDF7775142.1 LytTR family DNA-binding domain-containing protein [Sphingomonas sp. AOB5]